MILGNRTVLQKSLATFRNGTSTAGAYAGGVLNNFTQSGRNKNIYINAEQQTFDRANAVPLGYTHPYNFVMPLKNGGMASFKNLSASLSNFANIAGGKNADANLSGQIVLSNADMGLIVSAIASLTGSGTITNAELAAVLDMIANGLSASGTLNTPTLGALADIIASLTGVGNFTNGSPADSPGFMSCAITPFTALSPETLAAALLDQNDIETNYSLRESLKLILAALAGNVSGAGTSTITIRDINDIKDRLVASVDVDGNRLSVIKDVT